MSSEYTQENIITKIKDFKSRTGKPLTSITINNYVNKYKRLNEIEDNIIFKLITADEQKDKDTVNEIIKKIKDSFKNSKDYFSVLSKILNELNVNQLISTYLINRISQVMKEQVVKNEEEVDSKVTFEQVKLKWQDYTKFVDDIIEDDKVPNKIKIMFSLYKVYPLRDDYGNVKLTIKDLDNKQNFYNVKTQMFHLNDYKTFSKFGNRKYLIPDYIAKLIKTEYDSGAHYLVGKNNTQKFALGSLSSTVKNRSGKYYGEKFTINDIRHSVVTFYEDKSVKKKKQLADNMLHSYATQYETYKRK
tara:strand:+ start:496 stop:1404 length:909 start_codon:yes stop_codon:yes gene_type:complete